MDLTPYVENVKRAAVEAKRRNRQATERARADLPKLVEVIRSDPNVRRAYLYGSLAKNSFHPAGDIDIAVEGLDSRQRHQLHERLESLTEFPVDVRDLDATAEFRELVEFYGELLHAQS